MPIVLIFDVETTGLLPNIIQYAKPEELPNIIQISFAVYDTDKHSMIETYNAYIKLSSEIVIKPVITQLTGITREQIDLEGIDIRDAIKEFYRVYQMADMIVGHNIKFDINMLLLEDRLNDSQIQEIFNPDVLAQNNKQLYCTMQSGIKLCKLERINSRGVYLKNPKLSELYEHLFCRVPNNLHNSMIDVVVCLRCFLKMCYNIEIPDSVFNDWLQ